MDNIEEHFESSVLGKQNYLKRALNKGNALKTSLLLVFLYLKSVKILKYIKFTYKFKIIKCQAWLLQYFKMVVTKGYHYQETAKKLPIFI